MLKSFFRDESLAARLCLPAQGRALGARSPRRRLALADRGPLFVFPEIAGVGGWERGLGSTPGRCGRQGRRVCRAAGRPDEGQARTRGRQDMGTA